MKKYIKGNLLLFGYLLLFGLLLYKDPFSQRTLIPNLEPFPDTIHYVTAAESLIKGEGLNIVREGRKMTPSVPPLYSLAIVPFYLINHDPRMFYFANIILSLFSFFLFYLILKKIVWNFLITGFILLLYITNYFLYWYPTLAMAENLILPFFLVAVWLLLIPLRLRYLLLAGVIAIGFYATKYASVPLTASFLTIYFLKIVFERNHNTSFKKQLTFFISSTVITFVVFFVFEYSRGNNLLGLFSGFLSMILPAPHSSGTSVIVSQPSWFSSQYIATNFKHYWNALTGGSERFLWDFTTLAPKFVAILGLLGLGIGVVIKRNRFICFSLIVMLSSAVFFMSNFYAVDMRYIYHAIPTLLLGFGIFLSFVNEKLDKRKLSVFFYIFIIILCGYYLTISAVRIKNQIMLNIRHAEAPWYYISVLELNKYFTSDKILDGKKPIVISPMVPYYIDFFSNGNYSLLPLSLQQEFRGTMKDAWGSNDYSDLIKLYNKYLESGNFLYVTNYGLGNEGYLHSDFNTIKQTFKLTEVSTGCFNACNIYMVEFKDK